MIETKEIKLFIFDLDGTLIDTAYLNYYSYFHACIEYHMDFDRGYFYEKCFGNHYKTFLPKIIKMCGQVTVRNEEELNELVEKVHTEKERIYFNHLEWIREHPILSEIISRNLEDKTEKRRKLALASTASPKGVYGLLKEAKLEKVFDLILTGEDVKNKKPDPEIFIKCMEHFKVKPKETMIFEDSKVGIEAANQTGAWVVKIEKWPELP